MLYLKLEFLLPALGSVCGSTVARDRTATSTRVPPGLSSALFFSAPSLAFLFLRQRSQPHLSNPPPPVLQPAEHFSPPFLSPTHIAPPPSTTSRDPFSIRVPTSTRSLLTLYHPPPPAITTTPPENKKRHPLILIHHHPPSPPSPPHLSISVLPVLRYRHPSATITSLQGCVCVCAGKTGKEGKKPPETSTTTIVAAHVTSKTNK